MKLNQDAYLIPWLRGNTIKPANMLLPREREYFLKKEAGEPIPVGLTAYLFNERCRTCGGYHGV